MSDELIFLPSGARVFSHAEVKRLLESKTFSATREGGKMEEITFELIVKSGEQEAKVTLFCPTQEEADYLGEQLALAVVAYRNKYHPASDPSKYVLNIGKETTHGYFPAKPEQSA